MSTAKFVEKVKQAKHIEDAMLDEYKRSGNSSSGVMSKEDLITIAAELWHASYSKTRSDIKAFDYIVEYFHKKGMDRSVVLCNAPDVQITFSWLAKWADQAFSNIILGHKMAAGFMATSVHKEVLELIRPPWNAFLITLPNELIQLNDFAFNKQVNMTNLAVHYFLRDSGEYVWNWVLFSNESPLQLWRFGSCAADLVKLDLKFPDKEMDELFGANIDDYDERICQMIGRIIAGVCFTFADYNKPVGPGSKIKKWSGAYIKNKNNNPVMRSYEIRAPIKIDCRQSVLSYIRHGQDYSRSCPNVQSIVRGHWKRPPYGIEKGLPKTIWLYPYLRGPKCGRVVVHPVELGER